jgi:hypothetical protein
MEDPELKHTEEESSIESGNEIPGTTEGIAASAIEAEDFAADGGDMKPGNVV